MYTYVLISVILIAISLFLINFKGLENFKNNNKRTFDYFLSLISTFTGLFIALSVNTLLGNINTKNNLVKLLNTTNLAIDNCEMKTKGTYINTAKAGVNLSEIINNSPVELPKLYPQLETNQSVNDYFTANAFQAYILCMDNMETFVNNLNKNTTSDNTQKLNILNNYVKYLELAKSINTLEVNRLSGEITKDKETEELKNIINQITTK